MGKMVRPLRRSRARFPFLSPAVTSSPGAGEVFPQGGSQAVKFSTKVLVIMRKFPAVLLALPLGELARERLRGRTLFKKVDVCQHNICPNLSSPAPGKTAPPGQGKEDSVDCRRTLFQNIPELQQIPLIFILFNETVSGSLAIFPIDKTVTCRI